MNANTDGQSAPSSLPGSTSIDVGRTKHEGLVFVAVPLNRSETIRSGFGKKRMAIDFADADTAWLVLALAKELGSQKARELGEALVKCEYCWSCGEREPERIEIDGDQLVAYCEECQT